MINFQNSSTLSRMTAEALGLSEKEEKALYGQLASIPEGPVKEVMRKLVGTKVPVNKYAACIKGSSVRDAQYETKSCSNPLDDNAWVDAEEIPLFLGIIEASSPTRATQIAASQNNVDADVIELFEIK